MTKLSNSLAQADISTALHPYTNARRHEEKGPLVIERGRRSSAVHGGAS